MPSHASVEISTELLRTLHRIHRQRTDLQSRLNRGPRQIKASEEANAAAEGALQAAKEALKKARLATDEKQLQLKSREQRVEELQTKLNSAASNREFTAFKEQIAADKQANDVLSDEILEGLEHLDELQNIVRQREEEFEQRRKDHEALVTNVESRTKKLHDELQRVEMQLEESEAELPAAIKVDYERLISSRGEEGLAPIEGQSCSNCYQTLSVQMIDQLRLSKLVHCPSCGAWMYLPEDGALGG